MASAICLPNAANCRRQPCGGANVRSRGRQRAQGRVLFRTKANKKRLPGETLQPREMPWAKGRMSRKPEKMTQDLEE